MSTVNERAVRRWDRKRYFRTVAILTAAEAMHTVCDAIGIPYDEAETLDILKGITI